MIDLSHGIIALGVAGILLGLYGLLLPVLQRNQLSLPKLTLFGRPDEEEAVESLIADLEKSGFRQSPFEARSFTSRLVPLPAEEESPDALAPARRDPRPAEPPPRRQDPPTRPLSPLIAAAVIPTAPAPPPAPPPDPSIATPPPSVRAAVVPTDVAAAEAAPVAPEIAAVEAAAAEPPAVDALAAPLEDDIMALFGEAVVTHAAPAVILESIEDVTIEDLLAEAREVRTLLSGSPGQR